MYVVIGSAGTPGLSVSSSSVDFGSVLVGTKSTRTITVTASGTAALRVQSATIAGTGFSLSSASFPASLNPGQSLQLQISFAAAQPGQAAGTVTLTTSSATQTVIMLNASAVSSSLQISATDLAFGDVAFGSASTKGLTLKSAGTASVTVISITSRGADYAVTGPNLPLTLAPGQSIAFQVTFRPTSLGMANGEITISTDSPTSSTSTVTLSGNGATAIGPVLTVTPLNLAFGDQALGSQASLPVTLHSTGDLPVTVTSLTIAGAAFSASGITLPVTLAPNVAVTLSVGFHPISAGLATGSLTIQSNSSIASSGSVVLTGAGVQPQHRVTLTWTAPAQSPDPIVGYNVYRATSGAGNFILLQPSAIPSTTFTDETVLSATTYSYYATSVDRNGVESVPSALASVTVP